MYRVIHLITSLSFLLVFLIGGEVAACSSHTSAKAKQEMACCSKKTDNAGDTNTDKKDCCKTDSPEKSDCSGACGHPSCHNTSAPTYWFQEVKSVQNTILSKEQETYSLYKQPHYSGGVHAIWQPPKIG